MVVDILTDPAAFHHYVRTRAGMHTAQAFSQAEADALGAYLLSRLSILNSAANDTCILIGYSCEALNNFTPGKNGAGSGEARNGRAGRRRQCPGAVVKEPGWVKFVDAVATADPFVWKKWKNFRQRHRRAEPSPSPTRRHSLSPRRQSRRSNEPATCSSFTSQPQR